MSGYECGACEDCGWPLTGYQEASGVCADCCDHDDLEDGFCLICGEDRTEDLAARAYDLLKEDGMYGD
jgi:hypothetical protein